MRIPFLLHFGLQVPSGATEAEGGLPRYPAPAPVIGASTQFARADHRHPFQTAQDTPGFLEWTLEELQRAGGKVQGFSDLPELSLDGNIFTLTPIPDSFLIQAGMIEALLGEQSLALVYMGSDLTFVYINESGSLVQVTSIQTDPAWVPVAALIWVDEALDSWTPLVQGVSLQRDEVLLLRLYLSSRISELELTVEGLVENFQVALDEALEIIRGEMEQIKEGLEEEIEQTRLELDEKIDQTREELVILIDQQVTRKDNSVAMAIVFGA